MATVEAETVEKSTFKSLLLRNLPPSLQDRSAILEVLTKYGDISGVVFRSENEAVVTFKTHNDASLVKNSLRKASPDFEKISIQWCLRQRTSTENPSGVKSAKNPHATRSNLFGSPTSESQTTSSPPEFRPLGPSYTVSKAKNLRFSSKARFAKRAFDTVNAGGNIFSKALQDTASSVGVLGEPSSSTSSGASLFASTKDSLLDSKPFGSADERFGATTLFSQGHSEESEYQEENGANQTTANLFASATPSATLFGKPIKENSVPGSASSNTVADPTFGTGSSGFFANVSATGSAPSAKWPTTLFGKPVPLTSQSSDPDPFEWMTRMTFDLDNRTKSNDMHLKDKAVDSFPKRTVSSGFPAAKWAANTTVFKEPSSRPPFGPKTESGPRFANRVWVKNTPSSPKTSSTDPKPNPDSRVPPVSTGPEFSTMSATSPAMSGAVALKQQTPQTRSQTSSLSSKFADLFAHSANTLAERHKVLELRDKLLREALNNKPQEGPIKGTCPDMCPEKERYQRGYRSLVDKYEMLPGAEGVMDPCRMVKEYQRSSADQEFPLPRELRSPAALNLTMNYLIRSIISAQPSSVCGEWFTFIWNRTRAIRKDITQQEIEANPLSVQILERCSRFHIHCAHSLCEEDAHSFDPKLNNENFTKCLKSLKYSYHDLKLENMRCPNEAEFVAYEVLANLNDAGVAKTITDLEPEVRGHPSVKFAISAMYALHSGNYVRFFNLVANAPYMVACILHRFFAEVRMRALMVLAKSLFRSNALQLSVLTADLYFDSEDECVSFISKLGIEVDEQGNLNLKGFQQTDSKLDNPLSRKIAEKMGPSLAQVVYGPGEIPLENYSPQDSFTTDGTFKRSALDLPEDHQIGEPLPTAPMFEFRVQAPPTPKVRELTDEELQPQVDALLSAILAEQIISISRNAVAHHDMLLQTVAAVTDKVLADEVGSISKTVLEAEIEDDRLRRQAVLETTTNQIYSSHIEKCVATFAWEICIAAKAEAIDSACSSIAASNQERLLDEVVCLLVRHLAKTEHDASFHSYRENLASIRRSLHLARKYLKKWRHWVRMQKEIRNFPAGPLIGQPREYPALKRKFPSELRQLQLSWEAVRQKTLFLEHVDNQPIPLERIFQQLVRIVVISNGNHCMLEKCRHFLSHDPSVRFYCALPSSFEGSNVVVVLPEGDLNFVQDAEQLLSRLTPSPAMGVVWTDDEVENQCGRFKKVLWKAGEYPFHSAIVEVLSMLSKEVPAEPRLEEATLRGFVARGIEYCLSKVSFANDHLPTSVRLLNDIIAHLAAVASSRNLLSLNSLVLEAGWNSREKLLALYEQIMTQQLPIPEDNDRLAFIRLVKADKQLGLLTTRVNIKQFRNDFMFLGHIHSQLSYTLDANVTVRYLRKDFINYEVPFFWFVRPSPARVEEKSETQSSCLIDELPENDTPPISQAPPEPPSLSQTRREVQELLQRSQKARKQLSIEVSRSNSMNNASMDTRKSNAVEGKRKSREDFPQLKKSTTHFRASKQMKLLMTVDDLKRAVERLTDKKKLEKLLNDSIE